MDAELARRLERLADDLRTGELDPAGLHWLRTFLAAAGPGGDVRSDAWIEAGLAAARELPWLARRPGGPRALAEACDLFQLTRRSDGAILAGPDLAGLDWSRRYAVRLLPAFAAQRDELAAWADAQWSSPGGAAERFARLEEILVGYGPRGRTILLEVLHDAQALCGGWLPRAVIERIAEFLKLPVADIYGVTEFYELFHTRPMGRVIRVCQDAPCAVRGSERLLRGACAHAGVEPGGTTSDGSVTVEAVRCLGLCDRAPAALVDLERHAPAGPDAAEALFDGSPAPVRLQIGGLVKVALADVGVVDPSSLEDYRAQGGMAALRKVLESMTPAQVIAELKASRLVGRGGAAFSTGLKWDYAARNPRPRHLICNADESEPGAFKDRVLMDGDPFRIIEGILIAAYAIGVEHAFIYVRGEHRLGYERFRHAVRQAEEAGYLCGEAPDGPFACRIEVRRGAGAYVCGEETALIESIEGKRGFPRLRPPYPAQAGLWGRPTVINNVETLAKVPPIIMHGARWYSALGTPESAGTKLFCVSGSVARPGVYEVPFGVPLRHLIFDLAGGLGSGRSVQAVLTGGAAGTFLGPGDLDTPLSFEDFRKAGGTIGAGTVMVFDDTVDLRAVTASIGDFFAHESCGKCYPCQMGTQRQAEILRRVARGETRPTDAADLRELGAVMADTSICGLGQAAPLALLNALTRWPEKFA
jgi:NADH-quinone oxidoreductase subunit F